mgnify:CR=1 FL=1
MVAQLVKEGIRVTAYDLSKDDSRLRLLLDEAELAKVEKSTGDIRDKDAFAELVADGQFTHIIHLAGLQVPFCVANPTLGSEVNVTGTVNVLEAVRRNESVRGLTYASSVAVFGSAEMYEGGVAHDDSALLPATLYGTYKQANEGSARVFANDWGVGSIGLRPCIVYGPGRDQGLTSDVTKSMLAAAAGQPSHIGFGGSSTFQHAEDMAKTFIESARLEVDDARIFNVPGPTVAISDIASLISEETGVEVTVADNELPLPKGVDGEALDQLLVGKSEQRPIEQGVRESIEQFRRLLTEERLSPPG